MPQNLVEEEIKSQKLEIYQKCLQQLAEDCTYPTGNFDFYRFEKEKRILRKEIFDK